MAGINFKDFFSEAGRIGLEVVKQMAVQKASQIPAVQTEIEKQKTVAGKNVLWSIFPFIAIGALVLFMIARFK